MTTAHWTTTLSRHLGWMAEGHRYFTTTLDRLTDDELSAPTALSGWTGRHLLAHVGYNAQALGRLAHWAATGEPTPMYPDPDARTRQIDLGARWEPPLLRSFVAVTQEELAAALDRLGSEQLSNEVVTAQGRQVPAAVLPWLRSRELWIHAVDLHPDADFAHFPAALLDDLLADVLRFRRDVRGERLQVRATDREPAPVLDDPSGPERVEGCAADLVRWLTGRGIAELQRSNPRPLPELAAWL
jgi:maleylpyruvate isomerase